MDEQHNHKAPQTRAEIVDRLAMALRGRHDLATRLATELLDRHDDGRELALDLVAALEDPDKVRDRINAALLAERFPNVGTRTTTLEGETR